MKKLLLSLAMVAISLGAIAQENAAKKLRWEGIMNNSFWSNWELSLGAGANYTAWHTDGFKHQGSFGDNIGWQAELTATKWFNPILGARFQFIGGKINPTSNTTSYSSTMLLPHVDAVINLSNWIGGYREDRIYYAKLASGFGVKLVDVGDEMGTGFAWNAGLINTFRVSKAFDINLELKGFLLPERDMPKGITGSGRFAQIYSATVGVTYRFNKRDWEKAYSQTEVDGYLASIAALEAGLADAHRNEGKLAERLAAQKAALDKTLKELEDCQKSKKPATVSAATALFFNFDSYRLLDRAKASMKLVAEAIAASPKEQIFTIVGHADVKTGSAAYNQKLSEKRAKAVYDYLVEQGVAKEKLTWKGVGSSQNIFPVNNTNRVVIIK